MTKSQNFFALVLSGTALIAVANLPGGRDSFEASQASAPVARKNSPLMEPRKTIAESSSLDDFNRFAKQSVAVKLISSLKSDEFGDQMIFDGLSTFEPVMRVVNRGVLSFERKTFRTPDYRDEAGYDLISYEIRHPLGGVSKIMAYLDKPSESDAKRASKIVILTGRDGVTLGEIVEFESKNLTGQRQIAWSEAQMLFDREMVSASSLMRASVR